MKLKLLLSFCFVFILTAALAQRAKTYQVKSPDGKVVITVMAGGTITWAVNHEKTAVITPSEIAMTLANGEVLGKNPAVTNTATVSVNETIATPIYKKDQVS